MGDKEQDLAVVTGQQGFWADVQRRLGVPGQLSLGLATGIPGLILRLVAGHLKLRLGLITGSF